MEEIRYWWTGVLVGLVVFQVVEGGEVGQRRWLGVHLRLGKDLAWLGELAFL